MYPNVTWSRSGKKNNIPTLRRKIKILHERQELARVQNGVELLLTLKVKTEYLSEVHFGVYNIPITLPPPPIATVLLNVTGQVIYTRL